jgi:hypothetical protein
LIGKVKARGVGEMMARVGDSLSVDTSSAGMTLAMIVKERIRKILTTWQLLGIASAVSGRDLSYHVGVGLRNYQMS